PPPRWRRRPTPSCPPDPPSPPRRPPRPPSACGFAAAAEPAPAGVPLPRLRSSIPSLTCPDPCDRLPLVTEDAGPRARESTNQRQLPGIWKLPREAFGTLTP